MTRWVEEILARYGQEITVEHRKKRKSVRAFLQPLTERDEAVPEMAAVGWLDERLWLYLGRAAVRTGDVVLWNGRRFRVRSGRPHYIGGQLCHWRAVLERARENSDERTTADSGRGHWRPEEGGIGGGGCFPLQVDGGTENTFGDGGCGGC